MVLMGLAMAFALASGDVPVPAMATPPAAADSIALPIGIPLSTAATPTAASPVTR